MVYFLLLLFICLFIFINKALPIISGYAAKTICSGVFVAGRNEEEVIKKELTAFPLSLASCKVDLQEKSVTATVWRLAKKKAVYREGLGATLINGISEAELREQKFKIANRLNINQDEINWPFGNIINNTNAAVLNKNQLKTAIDEAFDDKKGFGTRAIIVLYKGEIVAERYAEGFCKDTKLASWSMTKSITNALMGILVKQNILSLDASLPVDSWGNDARKKITLTNLMHMGSGLSWWENYTSASDATNMLYNERSMGEFAMRKSLRHAPGSRFSYSSGTTNLLSYIIRKQIGDEAYFRFPYEQLFYKIGMLNTVMEVDASGTFVGSSYCYATAKDWARFGLLYMNDGIWGGQRILPAGWVRFTATPTEAKAPKKDGRYGAHWWVNASKKTDATGRKYPAVPEDCFYCQGYEGQYVWVIPSEELVVVRMALEKHELDPNIFLPAVIKAFKN